MLQTTIKSDHQLKEDVTAELRWDARIDETAIGVTVQDGVVTLTGYVPSYAEKIAAQEAAHRVTGVLDVANDIEVKVPGSLRKTDADIASAVRNALEWAMFVPDKQIQSTVSNGWVTLTGSVQTFNQRVEAERVVHNLAGVTGVTNKIRVSASVVDPEQIRKTIESALERQADREARDLSIETNDGVVTLRGKVRSWAERKAIHTAAAFAPGVRELNNQLTVDPYT